MPGAPLPQLRALALLQGGAAHPHPGECWGLPTRGLSAHAACLRAYPWPAHAAYKRLVCARGLFAGLPVACTCCLGVKVRPPFTI